MKLSTHFLDEIYPNNHEINWHLSHFFTNLNTFKALDIPHKDADEHCIEAQYLFFSNESYHSWLQDLGY